MLWHSDYAIVSINLTIFYWFVLIQHDHWPVVHLWSSYHPWPDLSCANILSLKCSTTFPLPQLSFYHCFLPSFLSSSFLSHLFCLFKMFWFSRKCFSFHQTFLVLGCFPLLFGFSSSCWISPSIFPLSAGTLRRRSKFRVDWRPLFWTFGSSHTAHWFLKLAKTVNACFKIIFFFELTALLSIVELVIGCTFWKRSSW